MATSYIRVRKSGTVINRNGKMLAGGNVLQVVGRRQDGKYGDFEMPKDVADELVKNRYCEALPDGQGPEQFHQGQLIDVREQAEGGPTLKAPGQDNEPTRPGSEVVTAPREDGGTHQQQGSVGMEGHEVPPQSHSAAMMARQPAPGVNTPPTPWVVNPASLKDKDIHQLNAMIGERLPDQERADFQPFGDTQEAINFLSKDFQHPEAQSGGVDN